MVAVISEKRHLENGHCSLEICPPKYKRRKVYAVRDFPPGCGPGAVPINIQRKEVEGGGQKVVDSLKDVESSREKADASHDAEGKGFLVTIVETPSDDIPLCSSSVEKATPSLMKCRDVEHRSEELSKSPVDVGSNDLPKEPISEDPKLSQDLQKMEKESMLKDKILDTSKDMMEVRVESSIALKDTIVPDVKEVGNDSENEMVVEGTSVQLFLPPHHPIPSGLVWKERKYPPRKRVSAVRDFPPGCGRNVQQLSEADNEHLGQDNIDANIPKEGICNEELKIGGDYVKGVVCGEGRVNLEVQSQSCKGACTEVIVHASEFCKSPGIKGQVKLSEVKNCEKPERAMDKGEYNGRDEGDKGGLKDGVNKEMMVYSKDKDKKKKSISLSFSNVELDEKDVADIHIEKNMVIVQGLMAASNCPWRQGKEAVKSSPFTSSVKRSKGKKPDYARQDKHKFSPNKSTENAENLEESSKMMIPYLEETETKEVSSDGDEGDSSENEELSNDFRLAPRRPYRDLCLLPLGDGCARGKVRETLRLFQLLVRKLLQGEETKTKDRTKLKGQEKASKRIDLRASEILKEHGKYVSTGRKSVLGPVPGVEVGDLFNYRMELSIIGLHRPLQSGIDQLKQGGKIIATSIVASGGYANDVESSDVLIYTGQGGKAKSADKEAEDQKLERGNLALKNSIDEKNVVRVIRGFKESKPSETANGKPKITATYTYDGLYTVEKFWHDIGQHGKMVYKFELRRLPGQPELAWKEVKRSKKFKVREGRCVDDISGGKENFAICAVNTIDDETPPPFTYITRMMYPNWCQPIPPRGCDCKDGCSDSAHCPCTLKNGGEIPYNYSGAIVQAKPLVYECGPSCKCPPSCHNRVTQHGIKLPLEIFKTDSRGWGVRSLSSIPSGSFICEYIGELLDDKEAEQRTGSDEYLFDIGQDYKDSTLWDGLSALMPDVASSSGDVVENVGFTIDAANYGNIGRFINHSCSPNLYAQNVLYDHDDKRIPHIMLFAAENIPPLQELTYHYNYILDQVFDSDGNIKKKSCYCGSSECTGRMY